MTVVYWLTTCYIISLSVIVLSVHAEIQQFQYNLTFTLKVFEFLKLKYNSQQGYFIQQNYIFSSYQYIYCRFGCMLLGAALFYVTQVVCSHLISLLRAYAMCKIIVERHTNFRNLHPNFLPAVRVVLAWCSRTCRATKLILHA